MLLTTWRSYCFLYQTWDHGENRTLNTCHERLRSYDKEQKVGRHDLPTSWELELKGNLKPTEYSQSFRGRKWWGIVHESKNCPPSLWKIIGEMKQVLDAEFHFRWCPLGSTFTLVQKYFLDMPHRSHCLRIQFSITISWP